MALQTSGQISLNDIHVEAGGSSGSLVSLNDSDVRDLIGKASGSQMAFSEWYGASAVAEPTSAAAINGQSNVKQITASTYVSSGGTLQIPSNFWVWTDSVSIPALVIDVSCTIDNYGKIIGQGGNGVGATHSAQGLPGGPAIKINSGVTGVTIINRSGAYIAGGGGSGGSSWGGSGGGAGGGSGGRSGGAGGILNAVGGNGNGYGGGAGGGGGAYSFNTQGTNGGSGGGGGRILPGTGGAGGTGSYYGSNGGAGGSAGNAGQNGITGAGSGSGGGGGWGAVGGNEPFTSSYGGSGGKAIDDSGVSYTLSNSGTIYGGT